MENQTQIFGIRAIIEAVNADETIDKVFLQKGERGELFSELELLMNYSEAESLEFFRLNQSNKNYFKIE